MLGDGSESEFDSELAEFLWRSPVGEGIEAPAAREFGRREHLNIEASWLAVEIQASGPIRYKIEADGSPSAAPR